MSESVGDPGCSIGAFFEVATICGVPLFDQEQRQLTTHLAVHREKMALLPKAVRRRVKGVKDDFCDRIRLRSDLRLALVT